MLFPLVGLINIYYQHNAVIFCRYPVQFHNNLFIVAVSRACQVVAHMLYCAGFVAQIAEIDNIVHTSQFAICQQKGRGIAVNLLRFWSKKSPFLLHFVPAQTDDNPA